MKNFWAAALSVFLAASVSAAPIFPNAPGATWQYRVTDSSPGKQTSVITVTITGTEQIDGREFLKFETREADDWQKTELMAVEDDGGVACVRRSLPDGKTVSFQPPQRLVPAGLKIGAKWELDDEVAGAPMHQQFTVGAQEDISVPAGKFRAFRFDCDQPWPISMTIRRWFVPGTGFVKDVTTTRGPNGRLLSRVTSVLQKFSVSTLPPNDTVASTPSPSAAPPPPTIALTVARERGGPAATEFRSDAPNIFVRWAGEHLKTDDEVRVVWIAEDVGDVAPANFVVDQTQTLITAPDSGAQFTLSRPKDGWAAGKYRVELYLEEELMATQKVTIID